MYSMGIIGLPNVGKSTLFNALTRAAAAVASYPFCTIEPNVGIVPVPDDRLNQIAAAIHPEKVTPATIQFTDIAGLVRGASRGEGLGNQFLAHIRETDALVHVVRCFEDSNVSHVEGSLDPERDRDIIQTELLLADLQTLEKRRLKVERYLKTGDQRYKKEIKSIDRLIRELNRGVPVRNIPLDEAEKAVVQELFLLTSKPVLYCANVNESELPAILRGEAEPEESPYYYRLRELAEEENAGCVPIAAELEAQLAELDPEERQEFLADLGLTDSGLARLVRSAYEQLDLITFYTVKGPETRAWIVPRGTKAPQAAGKIHSDMERGFIRAEVVGVEDLLALGSFAHARDKGVLRSEGKDYEIQDGDVVLFRFNV